MKILKSIPISPESYNFRVFFIESKIELVARNIWKNAQFIAIFQNRAGNM